MSAYTQEQVFLLRELVEELSELLTSARLQLVDAKAVTKTREEEFRARVEELQKSHQAELDARKKKEDSVSTVTQRMTIDVQQERELKEQLQQTRIYASLQESIVAQRNAEVAQLKLQVATLCSELASHKTQLTARALELRERDDLITRLNRELEEGRQDLHTQRSRNMEQQNRLQTAMQEAAKWEQEARAKEADRSQLKAEVDRIKECEVQHFAMAREVDVCREKCERMEADRDRLRGELETAQKEIAKHQKEGERVDKDRDALKAEVAELKQLVRHHKIAWESLRDDRGRMERMLKEIRLVLDRNGPDLREAIGIVLHQGGL